MGRCRFRPVAYRTGLGFLTLGFLLVAVGYGAPAWIRQSTGTTSGLWHTCNRDFSRCILLTEADPVLMAVRAVVAACLFFYLVTFAMALRENCCSPNFYTCCLAGRKTEVFAFVAELLGIGGMIFFSIDEYKREEDFRRLSWGHAICDFGLAVSLTGSIMMACAQQTLPAAKAAAGRIVANPLGYESLANNRSASLHSRSTQPSPFQGRTTPVISGPYPSAAAAAAANAIVSPKQHRNAGTPTSPQQKKPQSPYPALESQSSPSKRRKSSGQGKQFAGVHNQGKHPPMFASQHVQEEWRTQQSGTFTEEQEVQESESVRKQRALKAQMEQQQMYGQMDHTATWTTEDERAQIQYVHTEHVQHRENQWQTRTNAEHHITSHSLPPPPLPPAQYGQHEHQGAQLRNYTPYLPQQYPEYVHEGTQQFQGYQYPAQCYLPEPANNPYQHNPHPQHHIHQRPDSGNFPDPPPPEQLLCYDEDRVPDPQYCSPWGAGGAVPPGARGVVQPMVVYRAPSQPGQSPVTDSVAIRAQNPHNSPHSSPRVPPQHELQQYQHNYHQQLLHDHRPQQHQTFPRQSPAQHHDPHSYSTFGR